MKLRVEFGINGSKREVNWYRDIEDFPTVISHDGNNWEWVSYEKDPLGHVDWILFFGMLRPHDSEYYSKVPSLDDITGGRMETGCQCGAIYTSFPWDHMRYCPKWSKI